VEIVEVAARVEGDQIIEQLIAKNDVVSAARQLRTRHALNRAACSSASRSSPAPPCASTASWPFSIN